MQKALPVCFLLLITTSLQAQSILSVYDSLPMLKPKLGKDLYQMDHAIKQIEIIYEKPEAVSLIPRKSGFFEGTLTLLTGLGTSSSTESSWLLSGKINSQEKSDAWEVMLFVEGEYIKNRERIRNEDGSVSVDTQKGVVVDWDKGAYGLVRNNSDTLAIFQVSQEINKDSLCRKWLYSLKAYGNDVAYKLVKYDSYQSGNDFYVQGLFRNEPFLLLANSRSYQALLLMNGEPKALFQQNPPFIILSKKDKIRPYLLYHTGLSASESADFIRFAFLTAMIRTYQSKEILEN